MPTFALPVIQFSHVPISRPKFLPHQSSRRKRKRATSLSPDEKSSPEPRPDNAHASTNPLSLTPAEIAQYRLAGLDLNDELPNQGVDRVTHFPHRPLPLLSDRKDTKPKKDTGEGKKPAHSDDYETDITVREDDIDVDLKGRGPGLHLRHFTVLVTIMHRCLLQGDIPRASRAWAILIRDQFWGRPIDLKSSGYWAIGAELLIRSEEQRRRGSDAESDAIDDTPRREEEDDVGERWGSKNGWEKAKQYYEQLILQYPYRRQFQRNTNALDFWPAMLGCEIYGVQWEQREDLRILERGESVGEMSDEDMDLGDEIEGLGDDEEEMELAAQRRMARRARRKGEEKWQAKEDIRLKSLSASEAVAARMDTLMSNHPYIDSHVLLRLRAMLTLYIGDISVPTAPVQEGEEAEDHGLRDDARDGEHRLLIRQRQAECDRGKTRRGELRAQARKILEKIAEKGGLIEELDSLALDEDYDDYDDDAVRELGL